MVFILALGEKDKGRFGFAARKDGTPSFLQPYEENKHDLKSVEHHAYVMYVPDFSYTVMGQECTSASDARAIFRNLKTPAERRQFAIDMYGVKDNGLLAKILDENLNRE